MTKKRMKLLDKAFLTSFKLSEIIAKKQKPHSIGEEQIVPACKEILASLLAPEVIEHIPNVPLSNVMAYRHLIDISVDIQNDLKKNLTNRQFALQLNEGSYQLSFVRLVGGSVIIEQSLFCRELEPSNTGSDTFSSVGSFL